MVLDAQQDIATYNARDAPDVQHVGGVTDMEVTGRARRVPRDGTAMHLIAPHKPRGALQARVASHSSRY